MLITLFIHLLFLQILEFILQCKSFVSSSFKSLTFFSSRFFFFFFFFHYGFSNNFTFALCLSLFRGFSFLFFSLKSRSTQRRLLWLTHFYHFASFHDLLLYWYFTNKTYISLLIFVATVGNIKSCLIFHAIIIHPAEIFWKERSINVLINLCISFEVFHAPWEIINNFRYISVFQLQFV